MIPFLTNVHPVILFLKNVHPVICWGCCALVLSTAVVAVWRKLQSARLGLNILILSPFVTGMGLTITEANHVFHYGRWWNPKLNQRRRTASIESARRRMCPSIFRYTATLPDEFRSRLTSVLMKRKYRLADFLRSLPTEEELEGELVDELRKKEAKPVSR